MINFRIYKLVLGLLLCYQSVASAVTVKVDSNTIGMNETVRLIYTTNNLTGMGANFSAIRRDFDIVFQGQRATHSYINGKVSSSLVYTLVLKPTRTGTFTIPPVKFGNELSASVTIKVQQQVVNRVPVSGAQYFSELVLTPEKPYVQQEVDMVLRIYSQYPLRMNRRDLKVDKLNIKAKDALVREFKTGKSYTKVVNGQNYHIYEYRYKLFPQHSGSFEIPAIRSRLLASYSRYRRYYGSRQGYRGLKYTSTKVKKVMVKPRPSSYKGRQWLPAIKVSLSDVWSANPQQLYVGDSVSRTVTIEALGLTSEQLPELKSAMPAGLKAYSEKPVLKNQKDTEHMRSMRKVKILFLPARAGSYTIPEIKLHWWNVKTGKAEIARLPARKIQVLAKLGSTPPGPNATNNAGNSPALTSPDSTNSGASTDSGNKSSYFGIWFWLAIILAVSWVITMLLWWRSMNSGPIAHTTKSIKHKDKGASSNVVMNSEQSIQKIIKQSCENRQPVKCRKAILDWSRMHWPKKFPTSLTQVGERLKHDALINEIDLLNKILYASEDSSEPIHDSVPHWNGDAFWAVFLEAIQQRQAKADKKSSLLANLYPE